MAVKTPIVITNGQIEQLQVGDYFLVEPKQIATDPYIFEDFDGYLYNFNVSTVGTGGITTDTPAVGEKGVIRLVTGTGATGGITLKRGFGVNGVTLGSYAFTNILKLRIKILSTSVEEYSVFFGLNTVATSLGTNLVGLTYDRANNGDFWVAITRKAGVETRTVTSIPVSVSQFHLRIDINAAGTSVVFSIGTGATGAFVVAATHTTNISVLDMTPMMYILKTVGTTSRELDVDYYYERCYSVPRLVI